MPAFTKLRSLRLAGLCVVVLSSALCVTEVLGWGCLGHMLVAEIARRQLDAGNAEKIEAMTMRFSDNGPFPWSPDMVQAACWPDDVKGWHQYAMGTWHYVDQPYNPENISVDTHPDPINAVTVSMDMITSLQHVKSPVYMLNFAWVNLVHIIGDVHQPLHAVTMYSSMYPTGDRGGNSIEVHVHGKTMRLHALWDDICTSSAAHYNRPLSDTDTFAIAATADRLEDTYKYPSSMKQLADVQSMADESYAFAVNSSYADMTPGAKLSDAYLDRCLQVAEGRITLGGYRLGNMLNTLLENMTLDAQTLAAYRAARAKRAAGGRDDGVVRLRGHSH